MDSGKPAIPRRGTRRWSGLTTKTGANETWEKRDKATDRQGHGVNLDVHQGPVLAPPAGGGMQDVTKRKRAEEALRESEERYRMLFDDNPQPMWVFDLETLKFLAVNDAAIQHYRYSRDEFLAMTIQEVRPPEDRAALLGRTWMVVTAKEASHKKPGNVLD